MDKTDLLNDEEMKKISGGTQGQDAADSGSQRAAGVNCPKCGEFVPVTEKQLLYDSDLFCPCCGKQFKLSDLR